jgi:very-short-patch-repair endonuclease
MRTPHAVIVARAAAFRAAPTTTEALLWEALRAEKLGVRFRRQVVLGRYIADLLAPRAKLVVEVDGEVQSGRTGADARRDRDLGRMGYRVLRLSRELVQERLEEAVALVVAALGEIPRYRGADSGPARTVALEQMVARRLEARHHDPTSRRTP